MTSKLAPIFSSSSNKSEENKENSALAANPRTKRRVTLTAKEFQELKAVAEQPKTSDPKQQQKLMKPKQQRLRSSSLLSGIDPANIIVTEQQQQQQRQCSAVASGGRTPSPTSPAESQIQRANAVSAELDRIFDKSAAPSLRRSLRRKSFSISLATTSSSAAKTTNSSDKSLAKQQQLLTASDVVIDDSLVQLYCQQGTYKPPQSKGLSTIPEVANSARPLPSTTRRRFIDFDSPARLGMKDRSRCKKAQKLSAGSKLKTNALKKSERQMDMEEFKAYVDGLNESTRAVPKVQCYFLLYPSF
ncbi:hypothetical protein BOX15_Mlig019079g1 [Macrostomum lignano]|uniref:Uncharacterized protein n=1 Tax=Macrostomum lignano TaxID=282301 RepID=A0A267E9S6_9PLAT|nr:hypothetical protein BOX15_Mlig019079g1 [Macrostomum lignano]